jgi:hypothetical protein
VSCASRSEANNQGRTVDASSQIAFDGTQFVAGDRLLNGKRVLEASYPEAGTLDIELVSVLPQ